MAVLAIVGVTTAAQAQTPPDIVEYYHLDALGSVRAVTNQSGAVVRRHEYRAFGEGENPTPPGTDPTRFAGKERDAESGLDYFGARYYASRTGRFTTVDPGHVGGNIFDPQSWNGYSYALNNPLRFVDPTGRYPCDVRLSGGDAAAAGVADGTSVTAECVDGKDPFRELDRFLLNHLADYLLTSKVVDFSAGLGDSLLLGTGPFFRGQLDIDVVDQCSSAYGAGGWSSFAFGAARMGYAGLAKGASMIAASGVEASAYRQGLKTAFRLGVGKNWRAPNLANKTDAQLRASAGKTNLGVNLYGGGIATAGGAEGLGIGCGQ